MLHLGNPHTGPLDKSKLHGCHFPFCKIHIMKNQAYNDLGIAAMPLFILLRLSLACLNCLCNLSKNSGPVCSCWRESGQSKDCIYFVLSTTYLSNFLKNVIFDLISL